MKLWTDWTNWTTNMNKRTFAPLLAIAAVVAVYLAPLAARAADEFEPLNEATRQRMDPSPYLLAAYGFIWAAVLIYVVMLARGMSRTQADLEALRRRLDTSGR
jgi:hypothetical protein